MRQDSRIEDVLHTLVDAEEFVRGILGRFVGFGKYEAVMRIGISGSGTAPHYCIEQGRNAVKLSGQINENLKGKEICGFERRAVFNGRTHNPILEDQFKGLSWSSAAMTFAEVQALLGLLRANRKAHSRPAMAVGISDQLWSMDDIVALIDAREDAPKKRGPYRKQVNA